MPYNSSQTKNINILSSIIKRLIKNGKNYLKNVVIAGSFALETYLDRASTNYNDVDLFIHSCNIKTAKRIIKDFIKSSDKVFYTENAISIKTTFGKVQFIFRLYSSQSQIIHGFDIDSSCILLDLQTQKYYATKRCYYALKYKINTINFDRLSPSYEYRMIKYFIKGFDMFIPREDLLVNFDFKEKPIGAGIIMKYLITKKILLNISDYCIDTNNTNIKIKFTSQNPDEQSIGTFHKIILDSPLEWYGKGKTQLILNNLDGINLINIDKDHNKELNNLYYRNLVFIPDTKRLKRIKNKHIDKLGNYINEYLSNFSDKVVVSGYSAAALMTKYIYNIPLRFSIVNSSSLNYDIINILSTFSKFFISKLYNEYKDLNINGKPSLNIILQLHKLTDNFNNVISNLMNNNYKHNDIIKINSKISKNDFNTYYNIYYNVIKETNRELDRQINPIQKEILKSKKRDLESKMLFLDKITTTKIFNIEIIYKNYSSIQDIINDEKIIMTSKNFITTEKTLFLIENQINFNEKYKNKYNYKDIGNEDLKLQIKEEFKSEGKIIFNEYKFYDKNKIELLNEDRL